MSIKRNLVLLLLGPLLLVFALAILVDLHQARLTIGEAFDHSLADDARALAAQIRISAEGILAIDLPPAAERILRTDSADEEFFSAWGPDDVLIFGDADLNPGPTIPGEDIALDDTWLRSHKVRRASYGFVLGGRNIRVVFAETTIKRDEAIRRVFLSMVAPNILLIATSIAVVYFGVGTGLAPLRKLGNAIATRRDDDASRLPETGIPREAAPLIRAMNRLIDRLRSSVETQRRFLEDTAHQLKTPLTGLQTQLELALMEDLPAPVRERVLRALTAAKRLDRANRQLLALGRAENREVAGADMTPTDLAPLIDDAASEWFDRAERVGANLSFETGHAPLNGYPWLLSEMMSNLVDNAILHAGQGANIVVRCGIDPATGGALFEVEDDGPGIPPADKPRLFERFFRGARARAGEGSGLGLAIVAAGCRMHGAAIAVTDRRPAPGAMFRITFPDVAAPRAGA